MARSMVDALACADRLILNDRPADLVNSTTLEALARKAYAIELGFSGCRVESDWRKPRNAGKDWVTKVDWGILQRTDPSCANDALAGECMKQVRDEVRVAMQRDADFLK
eukprot:7807302-Lingulodinium_polyedra.AAC.1